MNAKHHETETHATSSLEEDLKDLQAERKHLETLYADRKNFYLVFAAGVLAFLVGKDHPTPIVKLALLTVSVVSVLMLLALIRTFVLVRLVLRDLVKRHPQAVYSKLCKTLQPWKWIIPNANDFLLVLPLALTALFIYSYATLKDSPAKTKDGNTKTSSLGMDVTPLLRADRIEIVEGANSVTGHSRLTSIISTHA